MMIMVALNAFSAKGFGEAEYWFVDQGGGCGRLLITGVAILVGIIHTGYMPGFDNWTIGEARHLWATSPPWWAWP